VDYKKLAAELINGMDAVHKMKPQKNITNALRGEAFALVYIQNKGGNALPGEIGQKMQVSTARVAAALNNLEKKGLITRRIDPDNRRQILVGITENGRELAKKHQENVLEMSAKLLELLGEHDAKEYVRIMKRLAELLPDVEEILTEKEKNLCCN